MTKNIQWLGHDSFKISGSAGLIFIDPFQLKNKERADIILITHGHRDHCSAEDIGKIATEATRIIGTPDCAQKIPDRQVTTMKPGDRMVINGVNIEAVPAYNTNKTFHPKDKLWLGYVIELDGRRIYHAGDTDHIPEMRLLQNIDIALLPVSGTYVMTAAEAVAAALDIRPKVAIPMHFGSVVGSSKDAEAFAAALAKKIAVVIPHAP